MPAVSTKGKDIPDCDAPKHRDLAVFLRYPRRLDYLWPHTAEDFLWHLTYDNRGTA